MTPAQLDARALAAHLRERITAVLVANATGSEAIQVRAINQLLASARSAADALDHPPTDPGAPRLAIEAGERLFEFESKQDWINQAQRIWRFHQVRAEDTVCVDRLGRIVGWGAHFAAAERDDAYPIVVYRLRADMNPPPTAQGGPRVPAEAVAP